MKKILRKINDDKSGIICLVQTTRSLNLLQESNVQDAFAKTFLLIQTQGILARKPR